MVGEVVLLQEIPSRLCQSVRVIGVVSMTANHARI